MCNKFLLHDFFNRIMNKNKPMRISMKKLNFLLLAGSMLLLPFLNKRDGRAMAQSNTWAPISTFSNSARYSSVGFSTTYTVAGTGTNNCVNNATVTQYVDNCTGITKQNKIEFVFAVYPNPNRGEFVIEIPESADVTVLNNLGQVVLTERTTALKTQININHLANGIYFVKAVSQGNQQIVKIVKE